MHGARIVFLPFIGLLFCVTSWGDTIKLKDGTEIQGTAIRNGNAYWVKCSDGSTRTLDIGDVLSITPSSPAGSSVPRGAPMEEANRAQERHTDAAKKATDAHGAVLADSDKKLLADLDVAFKNAMKAQAADAVVAINEMRRAVTGSDFDPSKVRVPAGTSMAEADQAFKSALAARATATDAYWAALADADKKLLAELDLALKDAMKAQASDIVLTITEMRRAVGRDITVDASKTWQASGIRVHKGTEVKFRANGTWLFNANKCDADGTQNGGYLEARVEGGVAFRVGKDPDVLTMTEDGEIFVKMFANGMNGAEIVNYDSALPRIWDGETFTKVSMPMGGWHVMLSKMSGQVDLLVIVVPAR